MPAKSPEALERKRQRKRARRRRVVSLEITQSMWPAHKITRRRCMPKLPPNISKAELRAMLAQAVANTANSQAGDS